MRATPSLSRFASTMTRPASSSVMCEASIVAPSAMPTRSAPSSRALALISFEDKRLLNASTTRFLLLALLELLQLARHDALVAFLAHPAHVPGRQPRHVRAMLASLFESFLD